MTNFDVNKYLLFEAVTGSRLYGLETDDSDYDYRGVCLPPKRVLLDPLNNFEQKDKWEDGSDRVVYSLGKFFKLALNANPNILELLYVPSQHTLYSTPEWKYVVENRNMFLSMKVYTAYFGYVKSQVAKWERGSGNKSLKAVSHVFRLLEQGRSLLKGQDLSYPLKGRRFMKMVRAGVYDNEVVENEMKAEMAHFERVGRLQMLSEKPDVKRAMEVYYELLGV